MSADGVILPTEPVAGFPTHGRVVGIDHGTVRIGLAVCDAERRIASPLETYTQRGQPHDTAFWQKLVPKESVVGFVIGLPIHLSGEESVQSEQCRKFGAWLHALTNRPVAFWDERFTSAAAEDFLLEAGLTNKKRKSRRDRVAAQLILQAFLDAGCPAGG